jgi:hypothetical protein
LSVCSRKAPALRPSRSLAALLTLVGARPAWAIALTQGPTVNVAPWQVTISWETDVSGSTEVHHGPTAQATTAAYAVHSVSATNDLGTRHSRTLSHLAAGTHHFRVRSVSASGAQSVESADLTFTVPTDGPVPQRRFHLDNEVQAVALANGKAFLGGNFRRIWPYTGPTAQ